MDALSVKPAQTLGVPLLSEFPLGMICSRTEPTFNKRTYQSHRSEVQASGTIVRRMTIISEEKGRLPNPEDFKVFLTLVQLSKEQGWKKTFKAEKYHIARIIGQNQQISWAHNGWFFNRITESLHRWLNTQFQYEEEVWEEDGSIRRNKNFHILSDVMESKETTITWHDLVYRSLQLPPWSELDFYTILSLNGSIARQLYCFLVGRFKAEKRFMISLDLLAQEHLGLSPKTGQNGFKRYLKEAIRELEERHFMQPMKEEDRFRKTEKKGSWMISFEEQDSNVR